MARTGVQQAPRPTIERQRLADKDREREHEGNEEHDDRGHAWPIGATRRTEPDGYRHSGAW